MRSLPPLNPLHVFVTAAKAGNFTVAAAALSVTPSAVSRQVASLETYLGQRLFLRGLQSHVLTDAGAEYFREVAPAFDTIAAATKKLSGNGATQPLRLRVLSTFGLRFLIPRLSDFRARHPKTPVRIDTGFAPVDFVREDFELSIQLGSGEWPGASARLLFESWLQPMCGPILIESGRRIETIEDLKRYPLLYSKNHARDWEHWLNAKGWGNYSLADADLVEFPNSVLMYQAAADGVGVALGQLPLLWPDVESAKLTPLLGAPVWNGGYYAVWADGADLSKSARQFLAWLDKELLTAFGAHLRNLVAVQASR